MNIAAIIGLILVAGLLLLMLFRREGGGDNDAARGQGMPGTHTSDSGGSD